MVKITGKYFILIYLGILVQNEMYCTYVGKIHRLENADLVVRNSCMSVEEKEEE